MYQNFKVYQPKAERTLQMDTNSIETLGELNYISRSLIDGQIDGGMINMDMLPSEKTLERYKDSQFDTQLCID